MRNRASTFFILFLAIFLALPFAGRAQYLLRVDAGALSSADNLTLMWQESYNGSAFALAASLRPLNQAGIAYQILDDDIETGMFYWVELQFPGYLQAEEIRGIAGCSLLWNDERRALVRAKPAFLEDLPANYFAWRIHFRSAGRLSANERAPRVPDLPTSPASLIQDILDSVSIAQIYQYERHLSGEEPYWINGQLDSMQTRYSYSPQIYKAQDYIYSRLEDMGYIAELLPFSFNTFYDVQFAPNQADKGWLASDGKIFGSSDGGQTWATQYSNSNSPSIWSIFPLNGQTAYAVGDGGLILKTSDGNTWQTQSSPSAYFLFGAYFVNENSGWICGDYGIILKTTNGGSNWSIKSTPTSNRLYDIFFADENFGWAVGRNGAIISTSNGGETWVSQGSGTSSRLYGVHFLNSSNGYAVGWDGKVLKTANGGSNWASVAVPVSANFYDVDFIDSDNGMIAGWGGTCLCTSNGGSTWSAGTNILQQDVYGFDIASAATIWVSGESVVAKSEDSGATWQMALNNIPESSLNNVRATKTGTLYPDKYYIICAHYDDTSQMPMQRAPGADDNASGTVAVLEAARVLGDYNFKYSVRFLAFAGEEQGLLGSAAYAANAAASGEQILGVINLDMIGYDGNNDGIVEIHAGNLSSSQALGTFVVSNINNWNLLLTPQYITSGSTGASDHASFWNHGYAAILMIEDFSDFTPFYHTTNDLLSTLNQEYFLENARLAIGSLAMLAQIDSVAVGVSPLAQIPGEFVLHAPYPNPFNPAVNIEYDIPQAEQVTVEIYDLLGRPVKQLFSGYQTAGKHLLAWDGKTAANENASSGIYFVRARVNDHSLLKKIVLMR